MKIGFIGSGKVGVSLGKYFSINGIDICGYYSKTYENSKNAAEFTNSDCFENLEGLVELSDIIFITTNDGEISNVWSEISKFQLKNKIVAHCSGSLSSKIFFGAEEKNAFVCSAHPMLAVNDKYKSYNTLSQAFFTIEGNKEATDVIKKILEALGNKVSIISPDDKTLYHTAACFASNFVIALSSISESMLISCGFTEENARLALSPLIYENAKNISERWLENSLTGPVERCDIDTVKKHLSVLDGECESIYKMLSCRLIEIAEKKNPSKSYSTLKKMLED